MTGMAMQRWIVAVAVAAVLTGCQEGKGPLAAKAPGDGATQDAAPASAKSVKLVDRDVEDPSIFQTTDQALWDGRPSLGGVWVASPDAKDPERVILRNTANGKFVIGALFRRELDNPGPKLQISSDAAAALGLLAGEPGKVSVTALRREEAAKTAPDASKPILDAAETVATETLDPIPGAAAPQGWQARQGWQTHRAADCNHARQRQTRSGSPGCAETTGRQRQGWADPDRHLLGRGQCQARGGSVESRRHRGRYSREIRPGQKLLERDRARRQGPDGQNQAGGIQGRLFPERLSQ